tara:strand:+ start:31 stop:726 length:696 start_codon:yes stop_codon:yes gene_type:complete
MNITGQPDARTINGHIITHGSTHTLSTDFCGNKTLPVQAWVSLQDPRYFLVTLVDPELRQGLGNFELMTTRVFGNTVLVGSPPDTTVLEPVPDILYESTHFEQLWECIVYNDRHNFAVVPSRLEVPLKDVQQWDLFGCFDEIKDFVEQPIVQYLILRAAEDDVDIRYQSWQIMRIVTRVLDGLTAAYVAQQRIIELQEQVLDLQAEQTGSSSFFSSSSSSSNKKRKYDDDK